MEERLEPTWKNLIAQYSSLFPCPYPYNANTTPSTIFLVSSVVLSDNLEHNLANTSGFV